MATLAEVKRWVDDASRIVVLTGAGISTESGIPDFRGPQGVWTKNPLAEKLSNIHYYMSDPEVRKASWQSRLDHPAWSAKPNAGHLALAALEKRGKLHALITQNIDELHQIAGNSPDIVIEVHGTVRKVVCMECGMTAPMQRALDRVRAGEGRSPLSRLRRAFSRARRSRSASTRSRGDRACACAALARRIFSSRREPPCRCTRSPGAVEIAGKAGARIVIINARKHLSTTPRTR
jgi:NAD-dependent deacetylase